MVPTGANVKTIQLAIEFEAEDSGVSVQQAAALIVSAALEFTIVHAEDYSFQAAALLRKSNMVDRFWFEDARWRYKAAYQNLLARVQRESA